MTSPIASSTIMKIKRGISRPVPRENKLNFFARRCLRSSLVGFG